MANEQNLIPFTERTEEELRKIATAGGKKSGEVRRMKSAVKKILNGPIPKDMTTIRALLLEMGIEESSCYEGVALAMVVNAMNGDKPSADWVRDTAGEKPKDEIEHSGGVVILSGDDDIAN